MEQNVGFTNDMVTVDESKLPSEQVQNDFAMQAVMDLEEEEDFEKESGYDMNYVPDSVVPASTTYEKSLDGYVEETETKSYTNFVSQLFDRISSIVGKDSDLGQILSDIANTFENSFSQSGASDVNISKESSNDMLAKDEVDFQFKSDSELVGMNSAELDTYVQDVDDYQNNHEDSTVSDGMSSMDSVSNAVNDSVSMDDLLNAADETEFPDIHSNMKTLNQKLSLQTMGMMSGVNVSDEQRNTVSDMYMNLMRGIEDYGNDALNEIAEKYPDDKEKQQKATQGLENLMRYTVGESYSIIYTANNTYDFLSPEDKQELDGMNIPGVELSYSDYASTKDYIKNQSKEDPLDFEFDSETNSLENFDSNSANDKSSEKDSVSEPAKPVNKRRFYDVEETNDMSKDDMDYQMGW